METPADLFELRYHPHSENANGVRQFVMAHRRVDLVEERTGKLDEPDRTLVRKFATLLRLILAEDDAGVVTLYHPDGIMDGNRRFSRDESQAALKAAFSERDYTQFKLGNVIELAKVKVEREAGNRYRVSAIPKIQEVAGKPYFPNVLWYAFEKSGDGNWSVVATE